MATVRPDEFELTKARIVELRANPVVGNFDTQHLNEIHRRLTQDLPEHKGGQFRPDAEGTWVKARELSTGLRYEVPYMRGNEIAEGLKKTLDGRNLVAEFRGLDKVAFAEKMADLYKRLDFVHPYLEANSRSLREFTSQLARQAGHEIDWAKMAGNKDGRDLLYLARDAEVWKLAYPGIEKPGYVPKDRSEHEAQSILKHEGKAFPSLATAIERIHQHREPLQPQQQQTIERNRGVDR